MPKISNTAPQTLWYSPDGTDIHLYLANGHKAIVGEEPRTLPRQFWKKAAQEGCRTTDMPKDMPSAPEGGEGDDEFSRRKLIKDAMLDALEHAEGDEGYEDAFTANGIPNARWLSEKCGFNVTAVDRDDVWREVQAETEEEEEETED